jgi:hypothetical protein
MFGGNMDVLKKRRTGRRISITAWLLGGYTNRKTGKTNLIRILSQQFFASVAKIVLSSTGAVLPSFTIKLLLTHSIF